NGAFAWGYGVDQAYLRLVLCEHLACVTLLAEPLGGPEPLPASLLPALLESRRRAGLGPEARGLQSPAPPGGASGPAPLASTDAVAALTRQEPAAALKRT
ncbi:MAG TPA: hypothetical protein PLW65_27490, partial [Pseudomonadota bacterium]|nr:hypothetical protein [Pseudomonadota bacterium]